jgi:hypothetical protein
MTNFSKEEIELIANYIEKLIAKREKKLDNSSSPASSSNLEDVLCSAKTTKGSNCKKKRAKESIYCTAHKKMNEKNDSATADKVEKKTEKKESATADKVEKKTEKKESATTDKVEKKTEKKESAAADKEDSDGTESPDEDLLKVQVQQEKKEVISESTSSEQSEEDAQETLDKLEAVVDEDTGSDREGYFH